MKPKRLTFEQWNRRAYLMRTFEAGYWSQMRNESLKCCLDLIREEAKPAREAGWKCALAQRLAMKAAAESFADSAMAKERS